MDEIPEEEIIIDEEIYELIRQSLKDKRLNSKIKPYKVRTNAALKSTLLEFLTCFRVMGYDVDGNEVNFDVVHSKLEKSAMDNMFVQKFGEFCADRIDQEG